MDRVAIWDDFGIRFEYPMDWDLDVAEDGPRVSISLQATEAPAFAMIAIDEEGPDPQALADEALTAMRDEYPDLDAITIAEPIDDQPAVGYDLEFLSLDMASSCLIRGFRTPRRSVLVFAQWTDLDDDQVAVQVRALLRSLEETDR